MKTNRNSEPLVNTVEVGTITVVSIRTSLLTEGRTIAAVADEIRAALRRSQSPNILLDFHRVEHLSIQFVSEMKTIVDEIESRSGTIRCCSLRKEMRAVLGVLGLDAAYVGHSVRHAVMRYANSLASRQEQLPSANVPLSRNDSTHGEQYYIRLARPRGQC